MEMLAIELRQEGPEEWNQDKIWTHNKVLGSFRSHDLPEIGNGDDISISKTK